MRVLIGKKGQAKQSFVDWFLGKKPKDLPPADAAAAPSEKTLFQIELVHDVITLPDLKDAKTLNVRYPLMPPYAYAHVYWDDAEHELVYDLEEPFLDSKEKEILKSLEEGIKELINISFLNIKETQKIIEYLEKNLKVLLTEYKMNITKDTFLKMMYYLYRDFVGMNEIEPLMNDYFIEDLECNGSQTPVYIVHRKYRHIRTSVVFPDNRRLMSFVEKIAQKCGKYVSYASPLLDGSLPDGSRVNATYTADISSRGPTFCFTDGYIQLNDGSVKKIDEFFEECKSRFGSETEDGNEVVNLFNLSCVGVDEDTLEQKDCALKTVIKLKPPEELVELELEDGSKISTTTNHLFHIADDRLKQIEAKHLEKGMFIPIPKKVNASGCLQKVDIHSLIQEFSYSNKVCIKSSQQIKDIINNEITIARLTNGPYRENLSQKYGVYQSYFYEVVHRGNSVSFEVLNKLCNKQNCSLNDIEDVSIVVYGGGTKNKGKAVKIPSEVDKEMGYLTGAIISDGHLSKAALDISCYEEGFKESIKNCLINKFGKYESYYDDNRVYLCNLFIPYLFNKVFGIPIGKKSDTVKVPDIIFKSDSAVVASFVKGLFDGDGTCSSNLSYKTYSKELAEGLTYLLARLGIYSCLIAKETPKNKFEYKVNIPSPYYKVYLEKIGFGNLKKLDMLKNLIAKQDDHKTHIRHKRIPSKPIKSIIKKLNLSQNKLSRICKTSYNRFYYGTYSPSFVNRLLNEIKKEKNINEFKEEIGYIQWMLGSEQEFVKIKSVKVIRNVEKKPVYDIELKPCKYFIAGNKPMNIFDTIRKFTKEPWTPVKLMDFGTVSPEVLAYLWLLIEHEANMMVIGGTGSGKTSFLNSLAFFIPPAARVVTIEDTRELNLLHENWLPSVARAGSGEVTGSGERHGEVSLFDLLKESFRQRPDYVIVGEIRGKEAFVLFQGAASGHPTMSTMHAESVDTMVRRLETHPIDLSPPLVETLNIVCVMTQTKVQGRAVRRLKEVVEIIKVPMTGNAVVNTPFIRDPAKDIFFYKTDSRMLDKISREHGIPKDTLIAEWRRRVNLLMAMYRQKMFGFKEVYEVIKQYYKTPQEVLKRFGLK